MIIQKLFNVTLSIPACAGENQFYFIVYIKKTHLCLPISTVPTGRGEFPPPQNLISDAVVVYWKVYIEHRDIIETYAKAVVCHGTTETDGDWTRVQFVGYKHLKKIKTGARRQRRQFMSPPGNSSDGAHCSLLKLTQINSFLVRMHEWWISPPKKNR